MRMSVYLEPYFRVMFVIFIWTGFSCLAQTPECTMLALPADGAVDVPVDTTLEWPAAVNATGYRVTIGRSPNGADVLDNFDVGNVTEYRPDGNLPPLRVLYVRIVAYNISSENTTCDEISFTTTTGGIPSCTEIINPFNGDELVAYNQNITWIRNFNATGYLMTIRVKDPDGAFLLNRVDVGNGTNFKPPDFEPRTRYYVTVIPFNDEGAAGDCEFTTFTTGDGPALPECPILIDPINNATGVSTTTALQWETIEKVDGYIVSIGTSIGSGDIVNNQDVGNVDFIQPNVELPKGTRIYVQINSYANGLQSEACTISSFVVEAPSIEAIKEQVPLFFTPNNDGYNDIWMVNTIEDITITKVSIFNRYGKLIKQMEVDQGWNGTFNSQNLPSDSYWYQLDLRNAPKVKGYFLLKR